jgi:YggT family protein
MVRPARRVIPPAFGLDLPSLFLAWIIQCMYLGLVFGLSAGAGAFNQGFGAIGLVAGIAVLETLRLACNLALGILLVSILLSWVNPYAPLAPVFSALAEPMLKPFRKLIPPIGGVDLSPLIPFLLIQVVLMLLATLRFQLHF